MYGQGHSHAAEWDLNLGRLTSEPVCLPRGSPAEPGAGAPHVVDVLEYL